MSDFERIVQFIRDEGCPKTPQEISEWTGIKLMKVYETLRINNVFFREITINGALKGWSIDYVA